MAFQKDITWEFYSSLLLQCISYTNLKMKNTRRRDASEPSGVSATFLLWTVKDDFVRV